MKRFLLSVITLLCINACTKGPEGESGNNPNTGGANDNQSQSKGPVTLNLDGVTATTVTFTARLDVDMMADYQEVGLVWSAEKDLDVEHNGVHKVKINKENYEDTFTGLAYDTDYYYTVYTLRNNVYSYGDIQTFKTNDVSITIEDISVTAVSAKISGIVERHESDDCISVGIEYSAAEDFSSGKVRHVAQADQNGEYSICLSDLSFGTEYYCRKFVCQNNRYEYRDTSSFMTSIVEVELSVSGITQTTAVFTGNVKMIDDDNLEIGVAYSSSNATPEVTNSKYALNEYIDKDGNISCQISKLLHNTHYYFRHYIKQNSGYVYGEVQEFTTNDVDVDISIDNPTQTTAFLSGHYEVPEDDDTRIGVIYKRNGKPTKNNNDGYINLSGAPQEFSIKIEGLLPNSSYEYCYCTFPVIQWNPGIWEESLEQYRYGEILKFTTLDVPITMNVDKITQTTATFTGTISLTEEDVLEVGLLCSSSTSNPKATTSEVSTVVLSDIMDADGNYSYKLEGLLNDTTHYYRYYIKQGDIYIYGDVMNFKTEKVPVTIAVENINKNIVTFKGNVQFSEAGAIHVGIRYYTKSSFPSYGKISTVNEISGNGDFSLEVSDLSFLTEYYWVPVLVQQGKTFSVGVIQEFYVGTYNMSNAMDLSSSGCANCYIVSQNGLYKIKTIKGNSNDPVGEVATCDVLWESFGTSIAPNRGDLIRNISHEDGYIAFQTVDNFTEGNAVIAARDANGVILWSWHIWLTDQPQEQIYYNNAGIMMDRNLGATSIAKGDVKSLGLLYQWGRKDPFIGSAHASYYNYGGEVEEISTTIIWPSAVMSDSNSGTISYTITHPTTFLFSPYYPYDWNFSSRDNTLWSCTDVKKSIYDPCPIGWRVPDGGESGIWSTANFRDENYNRNDGMLFSCLSGEFAWYPSSGYRSYEDGTLQRVGYDGLYWSTGPNWLIFSNFGSGGVYADGAYSYLHPNKAYGCPVRCIKE